MTSGSAKFPIQFSPVITKVMLIASHKNMTQTILLRGPILKLILTVTGSDGEMPTLHISNRNRKDILVKQTATMFLTSSH